MPSTIMNADASHNAGKLAMCKCACEELIVGVGKGKALPLKIDLRATVIRMRPVARALVDAPTRAVETISVNL